MRMETVGVLLSKREWSKLLSKQNKKDEIWHIYARKGKELNLKIQFFTINDISLESLKTQAIELQNNSLVKKDTIDIPSIIYNPTMFYKKKNIKKLRELSNHPKFQVLNEHHIIKKKELGALIDSYSDIKIDFDEENDANNTLFTLYVLGQKKLNNKWKSPIIYAKDSSQKLYYLEDASMDELWEYSQKVLDIIHFYYPGIFEIGIVFSLNSNGFYSLSSTCPVSTIVNDIFGWNTKICEKICKFPFKVAKEILQQKNYHDEISNEYSLAYPSQSTELLSSPESEDYPKMPSNEDSINHWIKLKEYQDEEMCLKLPMLQSNLITSNQIFIQFGIKEQTCKLDIIESDYRLNRNSFSNPAEVLISSSLLKKMHIPIDLIYQLKISNDKVIIGPSIGLLLGEKNQLYNPTYMEKYSDRLREYEKFGGLVIAFSTRSIDLEEKIAYGMLYDPTQKKWRYDSAPIPAALYRRNFHQNLDRINLLIEMTNKNLFNSHYFKKSDLILLKDEKEIRNHVPATHLLKKMDDLIKFIQDKERIILKPVSLSRGRGIFTLEKNQKPAEGYILYEHQNEFLLRHLIPDTKALEEMLMKLNLLNKQYLYQTYIPLLKINNRPLDVRVVMQKYDIKSWKCSGIECRVAGENEVLTNIARGGEAMTLEEVVNGSGIDQSYDKIYESVINLCQKFCNLIDRKDEHYAEFGLDIGLDQEGYPWIIEANIFPSFKGFKEMDYEIYLKIRSQPIFYAIHLQGFSISESEVGSSHETYIKNNFYS
ncbi:glutathione synthase/RimK-type ligase-like ATP-grasp enzyme [Neobacillus niacini]|uniref:YheC/YheD family endospore coat-associated protein n=1 Tax=Neobacillus niacini TaxID=86668 RepID=UPI00278326F9|nr:YheC/YheD family protein [Neobacillus niacini]MDQ1004185.1 glutathione synthase/RimK-type ligase-like ATP-grasp enzyme [Neobacillus niacini]